MLTYVTGRVEDAVNGELTLTGGAHTWQDTLYTLAMPEGDTVYLPEDHPWYHIDITLIDGMGDCMANLSKGDDVAYLGGGSDWIEIGLGNDVVWGGQGEDKIFGGGGDDLLYAGISDDTVFGGYGNDLIIGGADDDMLFGNRGNDILEGGEGQDMLVGGRGADRFVVDLGDRVLDFSTTEDTMMVDGVEIPAEVVAEWIGEFGVVTAPELPTLAQPPAVETVVGDVPASDGGTI